MKGIKVYWIVILFIILFVFFIKVSNKKVDSSETNSIEENQISEENDEYSFNKELEKVNVTGYHLVTYEQSSDNNSFLKTLYVNMENEGKVKFVIGTIEKNIVQERNSFEVNLKKGENKVDLLEKKYLIKKEEYLFMDIFGQDVLYKQNKETAKSLIQTESNKVSGEMLITESDYVLPFKYTLEKVDEYKALVIGNDVTIKNNKYGASASDEEHDYYYLTKARLENTFDSVKMNRINAIAWEQKNIALNRQEWLNKNLTEDKIKKLDLVIFQLGDNYSEENNFETDIVQMVEHVRKYSPNAEMIWIGLWNINEKRLNSLPGICERLGIQFINISDLSVPEYQSYNKELSQDNGELSGFQELFYPNNEAMQIISNRIMEVLKFDY